MSKTRVCVVGVAGALAIVTVVARGQRTGSSQQASPAQQKYPYPVVRDLRGVVPGLPQA